MTTNSNINQHYCAIPTTNHDKKRFQLPCNCCVCRCSTPAAKRMQKRTRQRRNAGHTTGTNRETKPEIRATSRRRRRTGHETDSGRRNRVRGCCKTTTTIFQRLAAAPWPAETLMPEMTKAQNGCKQRSTELTAAVGSGSPNWRTTARANPPRGRVLGRTPPLKVVCGSHHRTGKGCGTATHTGSNGKATFRDNRGRNQGPRPIAI